METVELLDAVTELIDCAARWEDAGDAHRATLARLRAEPDHRVDTVLELVCDGLAEQLQSTED